MNLNKKVLVDREQIDNCRYCKQLYEYCCLWLYDRKLCCKHCHKKNTEDAKLRDRIFCQVRCADGKFRDITEGMIWDFGASADGGSYSLFTFIKHFQKSNGDLRLVERLKKACKTR